VTTYRYTALQHDGQKITGTVMAGSREQAIAEVQGRGLYPLDVTALSAVTRRAVKVPIDELAVGLRVLANLLESGLSVGKTLAAFTEMAPKRWGPGIEPLRQSVRDGKTLAAALAESPLDIPPVVVGMLAAGEMGTGLAPAVERAAALMERTSETRSAIRGALAYPMVLAVAGIASMVLLVGVILPRFATILTDLGQTLPASTRLVLGIATVGRVAFVPVALIVVALCLAWVFWVNTTIGRARWHAFLLRLPLVGAVRHSVATGRVCSAVGSLLESGVPIASALQHGVRAAGDGAIEVALLDARERIVHGERPSSALDHTRAVTMTAVRLVRAGEESGRLAHMFAHAASIEQNQAEQRIRGAVRLLEPALILVFGGVVALVAAALLQAVYSVRPA
jgi:type II secretory pathway component PulF